MQAIALLLRCILLINTHICQNHTANVYHPQLNFVDTCSPSMPSSPIEVTHIPDRAHHGHTASTLPMEDILKKDTASQGIISNVLGGVMLFYLALTQILLYPIFSFLLLILSIGCIVIGALIWRKIQNEEFISNGFMIFCGIYLMAYIDLFLVVFQKSKILFLFLELERDIFLMIIAAIFGFIIGRFFYRNMLEEKKIP